MRKSIMGYNGYMKCFNLHKIIRYFILYLLIYSWSGAAQPDSYFMSIDHKRISLSELKGSWVFINYWASWCDPCTAEIVQFNRLYAHHGTANVRVFGVNQDGVSLTVQAKLAQKFGLHYPSLDPQTIQDLHLLKSSVVPVTYVLNPAGAIHTILYGGQTLKDLKEAMTSAPDP